MSNTQKSGAHLLGGALIDALGLPRHVQKLTLDMEAGKPPVVKLEYFPDEALQQSAASAISTIAARYELREIAQPD